MCVCECRFRWWSLLLTFVEFWENRESVVCVLVLRSRVGGPGSKAASGLRGEHLRQFLVLEATLQEFVLRQLPVVVLVHLCEYVLRPLLRAVRRSIARTRAEHVVYRLGTEGEYFVSLYVILSRRVKRAIRERASVAFSRKSQSTYLIYLSNTIMEILYQYFETKTLNVAFPPFFN